MSSRSEDRVGQVLEQVKDRLAKGADSIVPWFFANMPEYYFRTHTQEEQIRHLFAIMSGQVMEEGQAVSLKSPCGTRITYITPGGEMDALVKVLEQNADKAIQTARIYSSRDQRLRLDTFLMGPQPLCARDSDKFRRAVESIKGFELLLPDRDEDFSRFLSTASEDYVDKFEPARAARHFQVLEDIRGVEGVRVFFHPGVHNGLDRIMVAMSDPPRKRLLLQAVKVFARHAVNVSRAYGDEFDFGDKGRAAVISFYLDAEGHRLQEVSEEYRAIEQELKAVKWMAPHDLHRLADEDGWPLDRVSLIMAACEFAHQFLLKTNLYAYTSAKIVRAVLKHRKLASALVDFFEARLDPEKSEGRREAVDKARDRVREMLEDIPDEITRNIFGRMLSFFRRIMRTNYYLPNRLGLSFRMDPQVLRLGEGEERPFGFYCFHGPYFFGFHVRYRDMARGGVRLVRTRTQEQFELESNRLFDEASQLALAQQYKNKDIPEGGSKAVLLLGPDADPELAVKSMADSLLDLIVTTDGKLPPQVVDHLDSEEIIYLGPDENITPAHIEWIVERAERRGYRWPRALMSSKPGAGINHKRYGVTSEGVVVFAEEVLRYLGKDPFKEPFTVKLTGGPAGDVASNAVKILFREFGKNARVVSMSDGHGASWDPDGLDRDELMRLIEGDNRISEFDPGKLSGEGAFVVSADTPEKVRTRDGLHNAVKADLFIPAGGRPETINLRNWRNFLDRDGAPSSGAVVEGANLFISREARSEMEKAGILVVPGPSANKTGVICSSYEILAGLMLGEDEFLGIKDRFVNEVLAILRKRARDEARLLFREHRLASGSRTLTELSWEISEAVNGLGDAICTMLTHKDIDDPLYQKVLHAYCPPVLRQEYGDRLEDWVPLRHRVALLAANIASRMVYSEGLAWTRAVTAARKVEDLVPAYLEQEAEVERIQALLEGSGLEDRAQAVRIVRDAGRKVLVMDKLGLS